MHRSGTSIATRGLACHGVALGERLIDGSAVDNPTGYFEDQALHDIAEQALACVGSSWHDLAPIAEGRFESDEILGLQNDALHTLREHLAAHPVFAFKNPRTVRLHAFWEPVFARLDADVRSVLVVRHPQSVMRSLEARDGFDPAKSALLWLTHSLAGARGVGSTPVACIDYDTLIDRPAEVLARTAERLGLEAAAPGALDEYASTLLDPGLRHTEFEASDLGDDPRMGDVLRDTWTLLHACSIGEAALDDAATQRRLRSLEKRVHEFAPLRGLASRQEREVDRLTSELDEARELLATRAEMIEEREALIAVRDDAVRDMDAEIERQQTHAESLKNEIVDLRYEAGTQRAAFSEANNRVESLWVVSQQLRADHAHAEALLHARVTETLARLSELRAERETLEARLGQQASDASTELDARMAEMQAELTHAHALRHHHDVGRVEAERRTEELETQLDLERRRTVEWFHTEAVRISQRLVHAAESLGATRAWQIARQLRRLRDRSRRSRPLDATIHLRDLLVEVQSRAGRHDMDARTLRDFTRLVDEAKREIFADPIFRVMRRAAALRLSVRRSQPGAGPVELLENGIGELLEFTERIAAAPFATALPRGDGGETSLEPAGDERVDVVIPVHGDREATLDCIASVRRARQRTPIEIVVIDDASPDARLARELDDLAETGEITLLRNEFNLGFPATANRGLALHPERDVILLNSDTRVNGDWVDRLRGAAHSDWNVATATPFSNNAEICSYPRLCEVGPYPGVSDQARIDGALARVNAGRTLTIPTAVGFCMYVRRDALRLVGPFDALRFERGYGEENDLCMRLRARGLRNVLAADVYVAHAGGASFGDEKQALVERGLQRLAELYPDYQSEVTRFIADDPMKALRARAEAALLPRAGEPTVLYVTHGRGGGTERHVVDLASALEREGVRVLTLTPEPSGSVRLGPHGSDDAWNLRFDLERELEDLIEAVRIAGVSHVHFHHLVDLPPAVARLPRRIDVTYDVTAHDYFAVCPRTHMIDDSGVHCAEPEADACTACVSRNGSPVGHDVDVERWRARSASLLEGARRVFVPSEDAAARLGRYFDDVAWRVRPHREAPWAGRPLTAPRHGGETRVAVIGAIGYHKGSRVLLACAQDAAERRLPLTFAVIGFSDCNDELLDTGRAEISGAYEEEDLPSLIERARCQIAFLPSVWPETYSYTLSHAVRAQLHPVVFDLGAPAERVRAMGFGDVWPLDLGPGEINDRLLALEPTSFPRDRVEAAHHAVWTSCLKDYYDGLVIETPERDSTD